MVNEITKVDIAHSTVEFRSDGLIEVVFKESLYLDVPQCKELCAIYQEHIGFEKRPILHIANDYVQVTEEAREFAASEEGLMNSSAEAFVINSLAHKLLANFYLKINKPIVPTKFFSNREDAENWLKKYL